MAGNAMTVAVVAALLRQLLRRTTLQQALPTDIMGKSLGKSGPDYAFPLASDSDQEMLLDSGASMCLCTREHLIGSENQSIRDCKPFPIQTANGVAIVTKVRERT